MIANKRATTADRPHESREDRATAARSRLNEKTLAATTASLASITANQVCKFAVRPGWLAENRSPAWGPARSPRWRPTPLRVLKADDPGRVLHHPETTEWSWSCSPSPGFESTRRSGLRGCDIDFEAGVIRVRQTALAWPELKRLKTDAPKARRRHGGTNYEPAPPGQSCLALQGQRRFRVP